LTVSGIPGISLLLDPAGTGCLVARLVGVGEMGRRIQDSGI